MIHLFTNSMQKKRDEQGLTLIELLIVIVILGILSAIVVFSVTGITDRGSSSACKATSAAVITAAEAYYAQNGSHAGSLDELIPTFLNKGGAVVSGDTIKDKATGGAWSIDFSPGAAATSTAAAKAPSVTPCP